MGEMDEGAGRIKSKVSNWMDCTIQKLDSFVCLVRYNTCAYSSVLGPRWCADSWDTMEQADFSQMHFLAKALDPSG